MIERIILASASLLLFAGCQEHSASTDVPKATADSKFQANNESNNAGSPSGLPTKAPKIIVPNRESNRQDVIEKVFGSEVNFALMQTAPVVQACLLMPKGDKTKHRLALADYDEGPFVALSPAQTNQLRSVLEDQRTYRFFVSKACIPIYGVRIRFSSDAETLDVNLCFECNILVVTRNGKAVGGEDFDEARPALVALCQELFPGDAEIQKLNRR